MLTKKQKGVLDFVEANERKIWKREEFEIGEKEKKDLKDLLQETAQSIRTLKFWNDRCGEKICKYCRLRNIITSGYA